MKLPPLAFSLLFLTTTISIQGADIAPEVIAKIDDVVREEMRDWGIGGITIALIDNQRVVHAAGFGEAKRDSVFRVGSVSKLFNAVAAMQLVETGKLDLDAPVPADLLPINPYPDTPKVTLRQMLSHRSGLPRESSVGGYFDPNQLGLARTVASVRPAVLATRPGEKTRYSNLAPSIVGALIERVGGKSYPEYQQERLLDPLGMKDSAWTQAKVPKGRLIVSHMRVADGRGGWTRRDAPVFDLGTIPAGNLFSTAEDLGRFASALCANGAGLVKPESLAEMWRPQLTEEPAGFGLGFVIGKFGEHRMVSHNGAVYGHSTGFMVLPDAKIAVVVLANEDIANGRVERIGHFALQSMLDAKAGKAAKDEPPAASRPEDFLPLAGDYESASFWAHVEIREGKIIANISGQPLRITPAGPSKFVVNSRIHNAVSATFELGADGKASAFTVGPQRFVRVPENPPPLPEEWRRYLGSYGPDFIPLIITERHGHLYAMTENMVDYRLTPMNRNTCLLPPGMYVDEHLVFLTDPKGRCHTVNLAGMYLPNRRP
jgi:CubicO group peptidase (beta-lactamase class C family)